MSQPKRMGLYTARQHLMDHRRYPYRGCAPDVDNPKKAAGNDTLSVTSWQAPDLDGGERQTDRVRREHAAIEVCVDCPVMVQCLAYGASINRAGALAIPHGILGGMTALERHKAFVKEHQDQPVAPASEPAPDHQLRTPQKLAVLRALAAYTDPYDVAAWAGMDLRTANWQRSILVGKLGLPRTATRRQLLDAAIARGLLNAALVVPDDGTVLAIPPPTKNPPPAVTVQLTFDFDDPTDPAPVAAVAQLPTRTTVLEAAAA